MSDPDRLTIEQAEGILSRWPSGSDSSFMRQMIDTMRENECLKQDIATYNPNVLPLIRENHRLIAENDRLRDFIETCRNFDPSIENIKGYPNKESEAND